MTARPTTRSGWPARRWSASASRLRRRPGPTPGLHRGPGGGTQDAPIIAGRGTRTTWSRPGGRRLPPGSGWRASRCGPFLAGPGHAGGLSGGAPAAPGRGLAEVGRVFPRSDRPPDRPRGQDRGRGAFWRRGLSGAKRGSRRGPLLKNVVVWDRGRLHRPGVELEDCIVAAGVQVKDSARGLVLVA